MTPKGQTGGNKIETVTPKNSKNQKQVGNLMVNKTPKNCS